ncbi:MAG: hypothetical protein Q8P81_00770 [Nanoarchaeota archaeon]|nr:hypothetical protein [Nanoarchaeota archaeon]
MRIRDKVRTGIYGINLLAPATMSLASKIEAFFQLGRLTESANPIGAVIYGAIDIAGSLSQRIKDSKPVRLSKLAGAGYYAASAINDLFYIASGYHDKTADFAFDALMTYQLGKDTAQEYRNIDLVDDLEQTTSPIIEASRRTISRLRRR